MPRYSVHVERMYHEGPGASVSHIQNVHGITARTSHNYGYEFHELHNALHEQGRGHTGSRYHKHVEDLLHQGHAAQIEHIRSVHKRQAYAAHGFGLEYADQHRDLHAMRAGRHRRRRVSSHAAALRRARGR